MGTLDSRLFSIAGILSAVLFAVAGVLCITETLSEINYVAIFAGALAIASSFGPMISGRTFARKVSGIFVALTGFLAILSFLSEPLIGVMGLAAVVAMVMDALNSWVAKVKGLMSVSVVFAVIGLLFAVLSLIEGGPLYDGLLFVIFGVWVAVSIVSVMVLTDSLPTHAHKDEPKKAETPKEPKKVESKPQPKKVEAPKQALKAEPAKPVRTVEMPKVSKQEPKKVEAPKDEPKKEESKPQPKAEPAKPVPVQNNDFLKKLKGSKDVHRVSEPQPKVEAERVAPAAVPVHEEVQKVEDVSKVETTPEESEVHQGSTPEEGTQPVAPVGETVVEETTAEEPAEAQTVSEPMAENTVTEEPVVDDTGADDVHEDVPDAEEVQEEEQTEAPVGETPSEEPAEEVIDDTGSEDVPDVVGSVEEQTVDVVEESAHEGAQPVAPEGGSTETEPVHEDVPDAEAPAEEEQAEVPEGEAVPEDITVPEAPVQDVPDGSVPDDVPQEGPGVTDPIEGNIGEDTPADVEEELGEDIFTDNSPEALVRRAAWNKGLRCRRGYGDHNIPVAFVKGKVAVYVEDADADTSIDAVLREEGWTVLRYDASSITDGKLQGEEINQAVKANNRAAKASSKKKKKAATKK